MFLGKLQYLLSLYLAFYFYKVEVMIVTRIRDVIRIELVFDTVWDSVWRIQALSIKRKSERSTAIPILPKKMRFNK